MFAQFATIVGNHPLMAVVILLRKDTADTLRARRISLDNELTVEARGHQHRFGGDGGNQLSDC